MNSVKLVELALLAPQLNPLSLKNGEINEIGDIAAPQLYPLPLKKGEFSEIGEIAAPHTSALSPTRQNR